MTQLIQALCPSGGFFFLIHFLFCLFVCTRTERQKRKNSLWTWTLVHSQKYTLSCTTTERCSLDTYCMSCYGVSIWAKNNLFRSWTVWPCAASTDRCCFYCTLRSGQTYVSAFLIHRATVTKGQIKVVTSQDRKLVMCWCWLWRPGYYHSILCVESMNPRSTVVTLSISSVY